MNKVDIKVILALIALAGVCGVLNNLRVAEGSKVTWFGGQEVLPQPPKESVQ